jgi:hypothetical protein
VVLAEHTAQVAAGEEDRPRAVPAAQAVLLPEVGKVVGQSLKRGCEDLRYSLKVGLRAASGRPRLADHRMRRRPPCRPPASIRLSVR